MEKYCSPVLIIEVVVVEWILGNIATIRDTKY